MRLSAEANEPNSHIESTNFISIYFNRYFSSCDLRKNRKRGYDIFLDFIFGVYLLLLVERSLFLVLCIEIKTVKTEFSIQELALSESKSVTISEPVLEVKG